MIGGCLKTLITLDNAYGCSNQTKEGFAFIVVEGYCFPIVTVLLKAPRYADGVGGEFGEKMVGDDGFVGREEDTVFC